MEFFYLSLSFKTFVVIAFPPPPYFFANIMITLGSAGAGVEHTDVARAGAASGGNPGNFHSTTSAESAPFFVLLSGCCIAPV
jgi:hypothetical protein